jgi:hypothetical protein
MSNDAHTLCQLSKLRQADLRAAADADRVRSLLPRKVRPVRYVHLPNIAAALLRRQPSPRLAT